MTKRSMSSVLREILTTDPKLPNDEIVKKAKARGIAKPDSVIKHNLYNLRTSLKNTTPKASATSAKSAGSQTSSSKLVAVTKSAPITVQSAARRTTAPKSVAAGKAVNNPSASDVADSVKTLDLASVLSNVALVNEVVAACGGVDQARRAAEAIRACGSVEAFLQHVNLVADLRGNSIP
jgi:hypothetical protein